MPLRWHIVAWVAVAAWAFAVMGLSRIVPGDPGLLGFLGTVLTLLPAAHDLMKRYYLKTRRAVAPNDPRQRAMLARVNASARDALSGFEPAYALLLLVGISLIALGFAKQYAA